MIVALIYLTVAAVAIVLPRKLVAVILGILIPIDVLGELRPASLDALRYTLAIALVVRIFVNPQGNSRLSRQVFFASSCLIAVYSLGVVKEVTAQSESLTTLAPIVGLASTLLAVVITLDRKIRPSIFLGFSIGATASAADILLQVAGLPFLGTPTDWGTRYAGLSFTSTNTAPFLAVALVLVLLSIRIRSDQRIWYLLQTSVSGICVVVLASALVFSGGRGGVLGLVIAIGILGIRIGRNRADLLALSVGSVALASYVYKDAIGSYIDRDGRSTSLGSGRGERNYEALRALSDNWLSGLEPAEAALYNPHTPVLLFGLQLGIVGSLLMLAVTLQLGRLALRGALVRDTHIHSAMAAAIMFVTALLEPTGFYVGLSKVTLLLLVLAAATQIKEREVARQSTDRTCPTYSRADKDGTSPHLNSL